MDHKALAQKVAYLEFVNDQLLSELHYVDQLLRIVGFPEGLQTIKDAAKEVIQGNEEHDAQDHGEEFFE